MKPHWKLIAFEIILEIILEIGPASLSMLAAVSEYLVDLSNVAGRDSVQLLVSSIRPEMNRRGYVIDLAQYSFTSLPHGQTSQTSELIQGRLSAMPSAACFCEG
ncbi:hypothetical protein [Allocoleopsis franciscana]|uniref:Uncharacterized protein n=1 Tax=Allocoleopsis franciscana PCC 7113 TaxID=1173027 RepID=K9WFN7_9CYAN|nr:hypothetical protein [Allocoleopsis franciscana]AFZ19230.1 hypothetical protein Mic7113_3505 [Allocoleopsis franciscana PCC 7113]